MMRFYYKVDVRQKAKILRKVCCPSCSTSKQSLGLCRLLEFTLRDHVYQGAAFRPPLSSKCSHPGPAQAISLDGSIHPNAVRH